MFLSKHSGPFVRTAKPLNAQRVNSDIGNPMALAQCPDHTSKEEG